MDRTDDNLLFLLRYNVFATATRAGSVLASLLLVVPVVIVIMMEQHGSVTEHLVDGVPAVAPSVAADIARRLEFSGHALVETLVDAVEEIRPQLLVGRDGHRFGRISKETSHVWLGNRKVPFLFWNITTPTLATASTAYDQQLVQKPVHGRIRFQEGARSPKGSGRKLSWMSQPYHRVAIPAHGGQDSTLEEVKVLAGQQQPAGLLSFRDLGFRFVVVASDCLGCVGVAWCSETSAAHDRSRESRAIALLVPDGNGGFAVLQRLFVRARLVADRRPEAVNPGGEGLPFAAEANVPRDKVGSTDDVVFVQGLFLVLDGPPTQRQRLCAKTDRGKNVVVATAIVVAFTPVVVVVDVVILVILTGLAVSPRQHRGSVEALFCLFR